MRTVVIILILGVLTGLHIRALDITTSKPYVFTFKPLDPLTPVFSDQTWARKLRADLAQDPSGNTLILSRMLHNKITAVSELAAVSLYRPLDPAFIFSFPGPLTVYDGVIKPPMLYPIELPLVIYALYILISNAKAIRDRYVTLSVLLGGCILLLLWSTSPAIHPVKLILIGIAIRFSALSVLSFQLWQRFKAA